MPTAADRLALCLMQAADERADADRRLEWMAGESMAIGRHERGLWL